MALEVETKLNIPNAQLSEVRSLAVLQASQFLGTKLLINTYFDTPDLSLSKNKIALRIRQVNGGYIQTLKTQGKSVEGIHQRQEWEWQIPSFELQTHLLSEIDWQNEVPSFNLAALQAIFTTNFERTIWLYEDPVAECRIEIALDRGEVSYTSADGRIFKDPLCELELELLSGPVESLLALTNDIRRALPALTPSDISKAQRGYRLFDQAKG